MVTARHSPPIRSSRWDIATSRPWPVDSATGSRSAATSRVERIPTDGGTVTSIDALLQLPDVLRLRAALAAARGVGYGDGARPRPWRTSGDRLPPRHLHGVGAHRAGAAAVPGIPGRDCLTSIADKPLGLPHLRHQRQDVVILVAEESHPQIVVGHARDDVRLVLELDVPRPERFICGLNISHPEIQNGARVIELWLLRFAQHDTDAVAIEECQPGIL